MLSREQATRIAQGLMGEAEKERLARLNAVPPSPIYPFVRSPELAALAPWARNLVLRQALASVNAMPAFVVPVAIWAGSIAMLWLDYPETARAVSALLIGGGALATLLLRICLVRTEARKLAREHRAGTQSPR